MKQAHEILQEAKTLIKQGWSQGKYARDENGESVDATDPNACQWCAMGAVYAAGLDAEGNANIELDVALNSLYFAIPYVEYGEVFFTTSTREIADYNDDKKTTKDTVLLWFDEAIDAC